MKSSTPAMSIVRIVSYTKSCAQAGVIIQDHAQIDKPNVIRQNERPAQSAKLSGQQAIGRAEEIEN